MLQCGKIATVCTSRALAPGLEVGARLSDGRSMSIAPLCRDAG
jgi:hypothetical protein